MQPDADWIGKLQQAVEAAAGEVRGTFFYYAAFGLYFAVAVAGTADEDLLRGATVTMPGLGIGLPIVGFYVVVPALFVVFHVYALLQLVVMARRVGALQRALQRQPRAVLRQRLLVSPFAFSQRLFGEPPGLVQQVLLRLSIWLTLVLLPLGLLLATQVRFLPYHAEGVTLAHRLYIAIDALLLLLLWPVIIHPGQRGPVHRLGALARRFARRRRSLLAGARAAAEAARRRQFHRRRLAGPPRRRWWSSGRAGALVRYVVALLVLFAAFVVATIPGEALERTLLAWGAPGDRAACRSVWSVYHWLDTVRLADGRDVLCATWRFFEAPEAPFGLRRNVVVRDTSLVLVEPSRGEIAALGLKKAWESRGEGIDLRGRDLRYANLSGSDLRRADLRGANLAGAVLENAKLLAARAGDIPLAEIGACRHAPDPRDQDYCVTGLTDANLRNADLRHFEAWKADLARADLTGARLQKANLQHGRLDGALLTFVQLHQALLNEAQLTGAVLREVTAPKVQLDQANLAYAFLRDADLVGADLSDANLHRADLERIDLADAYWRFGQPYGCYLTGARFVGRWQACFDLQAATYDRRPEPEPALTAALFEQACRGDPAPTPGRIARRLWHELDYSESHDRDGYARVAALRHLLAKALLDRQLCPAAREMADVDVCSLHDFLRKWQLWRVTRVEPEGKPAELDLDESWRSLRSRIAAVDDPSPELGGRLDAVFADQRSCRDP